MPCYICYKEFSFFTKEIPCPSCGFSCCSKCLKYEYDIPGVGVKKICRRCYNKNKSEKGSLDDFEEVQYSSSSNGEEPIPLVDVEQKLDSLENPAKPPIVMYTHKNHWDKFKKGLEPADQEIVDRLVKLKDEDKGKPLPSDEDIRRRLSLLKDEDPDVNNTNHRINIHQVDCRTDQEKANDLVQEYCEKLELTERDTGVKEQPRLKWTDSGRSFSVLPSQDFTMDIAADIGDAVTQTMIARATARGTLDSGTCGGHDSQLDDKDLEVEEHSDDDFDKLSCVMCDRTENLGHCTGCHGDLYCSMCFEDNHDEFEMSKHKLKPVKKLRPN